MFRLPLLALAPALALVGCVSFHTVDDGVVRARMGESVPTDAGPITPRKVLEDSRCPTGVQCVWAGRVRISADIANHPTEMTLGEPIVVSGGKGTITLVEVYPERRRDTALYQDEYRFGFRLEKNR